MPRAIHFILICLGVGLVAALGGGAEAARKRVREKERPPAEQPADSRDHKVSVSSSRFNGKPYWQALGQCGGIYFKLNTLHGDAAAVAQVVKRDRSATQAHKEKAEEARKIATEFFNGAERILILDRKVGREEAVLTYDAAARGAGERLKSIEAAIEAAKPCPGLYEACSKVLPKVCGGTLQSMGARRLPSG